MPLATKKTVPQTKRPTSATCTNTAKTAPKKATSKSVIKGKVSGKKPEKAQKSKAGYELYSDNAGSQEDAYGFYGGSDNVKTLVGENTSTNAVHAFLMESTTGADINYTVEKHLSGNMDKGTPFNRRLVSSTPDPERLGDIVEETVQREENASKLLTEAERETIRQHLDAALVEETNALNEQTKKQQLGNLLNAQKKQAVKSSSASAGDGPVAKRRGLPASVVTQRHHGVRDIGPSVKSSEAVPSSRRSHDQKTVVTSAPSQQYVERAKEPASSSSVAHSLGKVRVDKTADRGSDIGAFQHFLHRECADLPPCFTQTTTHPGASTTESLPSNLSLGTMIRSNETATLRPLTVVTEDDGLINVSTSACSPVESSEGQQVPVHSSAQAVSSDHSQVQRAARLNWGNWDSNARGLHGNSGLNVSGFKQASSEVAKSDPKAGTNRDLYTHDGHYINQEVVMPEEPFDDSTPRTQLPIPSARPATPQADDERDYITPSAQFNRNNSSSYKYDTGQLNSNQNTCTSISPRRIRRLQKSRQRQPQQEAVAGARASSLTEDCSNPEVDLQGDLMKLNPSTVPPEDASQGPFQLHAILAQLKQCTGVQGDKKVCQLVQLLIWSVNCLPQLQADFSLEEFKKPFEMEILQLKRRNYQLNELLKRVEDIGKKTTNPDADHIAELLQMEGQQSKLLRELMMMKETYEKKTAELNTRLSAAEESHRKRCDALMQKQSDLQLQLQRKDHEALVRDQEKNQHIASQTQEMERASRHIHSLQTQLSSADSEKSILDIRVQQKELQLNGLQEKLGTMRQASLELLDHLGRSMDTNRILMLPCSQILQELTQTSFSSRPDYHNMASKGPSQLDTSGNQRTNRLPTTVRNGNELNSFFAKLPAKKNTVDASHTRRPLSPQQMYPTGENSSRPQAFPKEITNTMELNPVKESQNVNTAASGTLTVAALAAHNQKMGTKNNMEDKSSVHSWAGVKVADPANKFQVCCSDSETTAQGSKGGGSPEAKHCHIQQWSQEKERQQEADSDRDASRNTSHQNTACEKSPSHDKANDKSSISTLSEVPLSVLSEVPFSQGPASHLETESMCSLSQVFISETNSLSQVPISESNFRESGKSTKSSAAKVDKTDHSITPTTLMSHYTSSPPASPQKKYPDADPLSTTMSATSVSQHSSSPPASVRQANPEKEAEGGRDTTELKENTPPAPLSPNHSSTLSVTCSASQRDYFHGTELDLSMSTIPEDCAASSTMTGVSVSTIKSVDNAKFTARINDLDDQITQTQERLQQMKNQFS